MRMLIGVDWSEGAFAAVRLATALYQPREVVLVHGLDLGWFQYPIVAEAGNVQGYDEFRHAMDASGQQLLAQTAQLVPPDVPSVKRICEIAKPATLVLDTVEQMRPDLIVVGGGGRGRIAEILLGSVSHRIVVHAPCSTLVAKQPPKAVANVLVAVEAQDDAARMTDWLRRFLFRQPSRATVLRVVPPMPEMELLRSLPTDAWMKGAEQQANNLVTQTAEALRDVFAEVTPQVLIGYPTERIAESARGQDLLVIGSHVRSGIDRFLLGSVSHALLHRSPCSVLVVK